MCIIVYIFFLKGQSAPESGPSPVVVADTAASESQEPDQSPEKETLWDAAATGELAKDIGDIEAKESILQG